MAEEGSRVVVQVRPHKREGKSKSKVIPGTTEETFHTIMEALR